MNAARPAEPGATGLFGGTFNPVHWAHLCAAEQVVETLRLARMCFVPSATPPHKAAGNGDPIAPAPLRLAWLREALADNPRFEVDPLEIDRGGTSYMVETLDILAARLSPQRAVFVIGWDAFVEIDSWREPARLFELADFAVMMRPPISDPSLHGSLPACLRGAEVARDGRSARLAGSPGWIRLVPVTPLAISASGVRARLREGRTVRYLLPERVHDAIVKSGVYGPTSPPAAPAPAGNEEDR